MVRPKSHKVSRKKSRHSSKTISLCFLAILLVCLMGSTASLLSQENPQGTLQLKKVYEIISDAEIRQIETEAQTPTAKPDAILQNSRALLDRYYGQFIDDKRIFDERSRPLYDPARWDANRRRLLRLARSRRTDPGFFLGHAPYLQRLFRLTARAYEKKNDAARAMWAWGMSLRYGLFESNTPDFFLPKDASQSTDVPLPNSQKEKQNAKEAVYLKMLRGFANKDRLMQEDDPKIKQAAKVFPEILKEYQKAQEDCKNFAKSVYAAEANALRGIRQARSAQEWRKLRDRRCQRATETFARLEQIRQGAYRKYLRQVGTQSGEAAYQMALLARRMHQKEAARQRQLNHESYLRGEGELLETNRTRYRNFPAYGALLELAHRFDPEKPKYLDLLVTQKRIERKPEVALAYQKQLIDLLNKTKNNMSYQEQLYFALQYKRLGEIESGRKRYVAATQAFEKFLDESSNLQFPSREKNDALASTLKKVKKNLADLYFQKTGNLKRARELYTQESKDFFLTEKKEPKAQARAYRALERLAFIYKKFRQSKEELEHLQKADRIFRALQAERNRLKESKKNLQDRLRRLKARLREYDDAAEDTQRLPYYRLLRVDLPKIEGQLGFIERLMQKLFHTRLLFRLSEIHFGNKNFRKSQAIFQRILNEGTGRERSLSRRNLLQIEKILSDGIARPLIRK